MKIESPKNSDLAQRLFVILGRYSKDMAEFTDLMVAIHSVNMHDDLVKMLEKVTNSHEEMAYAYCGDGKYMRTQLASEAIALLARAKQEKGGDVDG